VNNKCYQPFNYDLNLERRMLDLKCPHFKSSAGSLITEMISHTTAQSAASQQLSRQENHYKILKVKQKPL
jgi:hypothetical protein